MVRGAPRKKALQMTTQNAMTTKEYHIGAAIVRMTAAQATRWNCCASTETDLRTVQVYSIEAERWITLRRAACVRLEPWLAEQLDGNSAFLLHKEDAQ